MINLGRTSHWNSRNLSKSLTENPYKYQVNYIINNNLNKNYQL